MLGRQRPSMDCDQCYYFNRNCQSRAHVCKLSAGDVLVDCRTFRTWSKAGEGGSPQGWQ